jgi:mannose-6-phosphate isomerase-like protein (cupin superfamily)
MKPAVFSIAQELATLVPGGDFRLLDHHLADGPVMAGVIRIDADSVKGFWERHDGGDEILVILAGRATFTIRSADGDMRLEVGPGDALCVPRSMAHNAVLHTPALDILFFTPRDGSAAWTDDPSITSRH